MELTPFLLSSFPPAIPAGLDGNIERIQARLAFTR
jgi:hypothetical protein